MHVINVLYSTTMAMYEHLSYPHNYMDDNWSTFLVVEKIQINYYSFQMIPQSYWTAYLQTPMIGSGAPAQMDISHLLRN